MPILERITEGIATYRSLAKADPDMVVLSESARRKLLDEGGPYSIAPVDPETIPPGEVGTVKGVPIRVLSDLPGDYVRVVHRV